MILFNTKVTVIGKIKAASINKFILFLLLNWLRLLGSFPLEWKYKKNNHKKDEFCKKNSRFNLHFKVNIFFYFCSLFSQIFGSFLVLKFLFSSFEKFTGQELFSDIDSNKTVIITFAIVYYTTYVFATILYLVILLQMPSYSKVLNEGFRYIKNQSLPYYMILFTILNSFIYIFFPIAKMISVYASNEDFVLFYRFFTAPKGPIFIVLFYILSSCIGKAWNLNYVPEDNWKTIKRSTEHFIFNNFKQSIHLLTIKTNKKEDLSLPISQDIIKQLCKKAIHLNQLQHKMNDSLKLILSGTMVLNIINVISSFFIFAESYYGSHWPIQVACLFNSLLEIYMSVNLSRNSEKQVIIKFDKKNCLVSLSILRHI